MVIVRKIFLDLPYEILAKRGMVAKEISVFIGTRNAFSGKTAFDKSASIRSTHLSIIYFQKKLLSSRLMRMLGLSVFHN